MAKLQNKLPHLLSDCLTIALKDMDKCYKSPKFMIDMTEYFSIYGTPRLSEILKPSVGTPCHVCLAGGVIAKTINGGDLQKFDELTPQDLFSRDFITEHDRNRLYALDQLRQGRIQGAFCCLLAWPPSYTVKTNMPISTPQFEEATHPDSRGHVETYKTFRKELFAIRDYLVSEGL